MKLNNFKIKGGIYIVLEELELDLHNDYDFIELRFDNVNRRVKLLWNRAKGDWVKPDLPGKIEIEIEGVYHFEVSPRDPKLPYTEDLCLEDISYSTDGAGPFWTSQAYDEKWKWVISFMSGTWITIGAQQAKAIILS